MGKQGTDLHSSGFDQMLAYEVVKDGFLDEHIQVIRQVYGERRDVMLAALERYFPEGCSWTRPEGGLFLWARVPEWIDTGEMLHEAVACQGGLCAGLCVLCRGGPRRATRCASTSPTRSRSRSKRASAGWAILLKTKISRDNRHRSGS